MTKVYHIQVYIRSNIKCSCFQFFSSHSLNEGFIKTGDVGRFDEIGDLYHTGRKKELLKYCNFQIAPSEIDAYLTESSHIESACVAGIPDTMGDLLVAAIVRANGSTITEVDVQNLVAGKFGQSYFR